jgi:phospholipase C
VEDPIAINQPRRAASVAFLVVFLVVAATTVWIVDRPARSPCPSLDNTSAAKSPIKHLFMIIKENHALENYFGTYPGVIGYPPNGTFPTAFLGNGTTGAISPFPLNATSTPDLPHDRPGELLDLDNGKNDLFVAVASRDNAPAPQDAVGYYTAAQIGGYFAIAHNYTLDDSFFSGVLGPTTPNRLFDLGATSGNWTTDAIPPPANTTFPTIIGQLNAAGIPWNYDYSGTEANLTPLLIPAIASSSCQVALIQPLSGLAGQLAAPTPPAVMVIDPSHDANYSEHPPQNVTLGADWTLSVLQTIFSSPVGPSSAVLIWWDEAGGFWDPVAPPTEGPLGDGFRIPLLVVSPWTPAGVIDHETLDPASVLSFVDSNWGLPPLNARVAAAPGLSSVFNFSQAPRPYEGLAGSISLDSDRSIPLKGVAGPGHPSAETVASPFPHDFWQARGFSESLFCAPREVRRATPYARSEVGAVVTPPRPPPASAGPRDHGRWSIASSRARAAGHSDRMTL